MLIFFAMVLVVIAIFISRGTEIGRIIESAFVFAPIEILSRIRPAHAIIFGLAGIVCIFTVYILKVKIIGFLTWVAPDIIFWIITFDVVTWLDAIIIMLMAKSMVNLGQLRMWARSAIKGLSHAHLRILAGVRRK